MDSFLGNTRQFFQGLPSSTRGYGHPAPRDESHAPPTPTPPATPTLPPAHPYHPYPQPMTGAVPATSVPGLLPPSRPMTPVTPSHKPPDHSASASPYNIPFLHPTGTKHSSADARFLQLEQHYRQGSLPAGPVVAPSSTRSQSHNNGQGLSVESRTSSRTYAKPSSLPGEGRSHMPVHTTQALGTDLRHSRIYNSTQPLPNDVRMFPHPYGSQNSADSRVAAAAAAAAATTTATATATAPPPPHSDSKYFPRPEPRPPDPRIPEARDLRADPHQEHWGPYGTPHTKSLERLAPSVHIAEASASVNGSKDARYLGKKPEEIANVSRPENSLFRKGIESLQVNGSRDSLYPNGSHSIHSIETKRDPSSEMKIDNRPKEDSALDLSVKTVRQTFDSSAASTEKSHSQSPHVTTPLVEKSSKDPQRRTPSSSVPVSSPYSRTPSRDASPSQLSELIKNAPGISGTSKGASPSHSHQYGITGSPRPLESASPLTQPLHMLPPTKRTGDPPYYDHASKYPRLSLNSSSKAPSSAADHALDRSLISAHKDTLIDQSRGLPLYVASSVSKELDIRYSGESKIEKRPLHPDARDHSGDWRERRDLSSERRDLSISIERKNPTLDIRDSSLERRNPVNESRDLSFTRKNAAPEGKDSSYDKRDTLTIEPKYPYGNHPAAIAASVDPYRTWMMNYDHSKYNSVSIDRQKYVPGSQPVPTSVPTSLPHQNSRVPSAQLHSSYQHPPDTRLPQTPYTSQASHTAASARAPSQGSSAQSTPAKIHQPYMQQSLSNSSGSSSSSSRTSQIPSTHGSSHPSQSPGTAGHLNSASQPHYPYPYNHAVAAHYAQQQQQHHRQPRPPSAYPPFSLPQSTKSSSLPPPALTPQQVHQPYLYPQHRSDPSLSLYPSKRSNQLSPHPSGSPHPSISPHPSASPNTAASPHPAASPHHMITSPRSAVSPHVAQQSRISQYSPHPAQRPPSASSMQHNYPGSLPPSPYSGHQSHVSHTTPPSSRPSSATSQHSLSSQTTTTSSQPQRSPYPSSAHPQSPVNPPQSNTSHQSQNFPVSSQSQSPHPSQGPPTHSSQTRTGSHPQPPVSHSLQVSSPAVSSVQSQYSPASHPSVTHHTQASISSQAHPTWVTPPYAGHTTKIAEGHASQPHPSHSYPPQSYSHHPYTAKTPSQSRSSHPSPSPQHHPPHPSQSHPSSQARSPHPSQAHPAQQPSTSQSQSTHPSQVPAPQTQPPQAHPPHPSQPHPSQQPQPPPSQTHPAHPSRSQANPPHPSTSPAHPPHPSPSPAHAPHPSRSPAHPPHPSPSPAHSAHPSRSPAHPPHPSPSPAHPAHPSMSPAHSAHPSPSSAHPSHPSPAHTSHPPQAHPPHPSQQRHTSQPSQAQPPHPSQSQPLRPSHAHPPQPSQAHLPHPSQAHPQHPSQTHPPHPSQAHSSQAPPHPSQAHPLHPSQVHPSHSSHPSQAHPPHPSHPSQAHPPHPSHPSQAHPSHPSQAHPPHPSHPSQAHPPHPSQPHPPHPSQAHPPHPSHPSQAHPPHPSHPSQAHPPHPSHPSQAHPPHPSHPSQAHPPHPSHPSQAHPPHPSHPSQAHPPHPSHPHPSHPSQAHPLHPSQAHPPHPSQAHHPHPSQAHPPRPSQAHPPHPSQAHLPHPSQAHHPHPSQAHPPHLSQSHPPHPSQAHHPHPSQTHPTPTSPQYPPPPQSQPPHPGQAQPPHATQAQPQHSSQAQPRSSPVHPPQDPSRQSSQAHPHLSQPPLTQQSQAHPSHVYGSHPYPPHGHSSHGHPPNMGTSQGHPSQTRHMQGHHQPHSPRGLPPQSQAQSHPQSHSPRGHPSQSISPRGHASHPHPASGHPHAYPPQEYPPPSHPPHDSSLQAYSLHDHSSQSHPLMQLPYPSAVRSQTIHPHQSSDPYALHPHVPHPTPGHHTDSLQPHPHPGYPPHGHHPYYPPHQQYPHHPIKTENLACSSQYSAYPYQSHASGKQESLPPNRAQPSNPAQPPPGALSSPRPPQDFDPSRIRTKGEQKSFDPRNAESGNSDCKSEAQSGYQPNHQKVNSLPIADVTKEQQAGGTKPVVEGLKLSNLEGDQKVPIIGKEEGKAEVVQSANKALEPGKAALAVKLHKKLQHAESMESLETKKENIPENIVPKKEEKEEDDWDKGFDKLMEDLASNPDSVTSKKCRNLGRKYLHKVQIQNAIDNDLIVPPSVPIEEEEDESEPEAPVKFRGKFKSIKDKKVERLILTYASHSDESALDMIPDEDASDFEEELKREIRLKSKKRGRDKKKVTGDSSSGSEAEKVGRKRSGGRGTNKENKPNNKQDSDFSFSTSNTSSDSSDSDSSDESDTEDSDLEELVRPGRKGKKSDIERRKLRKKWDSDSSDSEEVLPQRRPRRGHKYSSDEDSFKPLQRSKKRRKKQESSDSDEIPTKTSRRKRKSDSEEDDEVITRRGKKKGSLNKKFKKASKEDSDEDSERETPRKTRGMKKKIQELKKGKRKKQMPMVSSDSEEITDKKDKKIDGRKKRGKIKAKSIEDSSEESDIPTKKKSSPKSNVIVDSDESDSNSRNVASKAKEPEIEEPIVDEEKGEIKTEAKEEADVQEVEENLGDIDDEDDANKEPDSVIEKLKKIREEELNREDVQEMKAWLGEVNREIEKQLVKFQDLTLRNNWKKPQFGGGEDFLHGWQNEVKKYKEQTGRFPKKLCHAAKHQAASTPSKSSPRKAKDQEQAKDSPKRGSSSPAKNTRSKSGIIKTSMAVAEDTRLKVAARPEISSVMQRFFEKVLAETGSDSAKEESPCRKFTLGPFPAYGSQRVPTGLTPTPSLAPSMIGSDDSDMDSLASLRMDLPVSDSVTVSKRSIANSLLKKIGRKYNVKKLNTLYLNKTRSILEVSNKPQLLPTPGIPASEKDLEEMSPEQLRVATFFRKETVDNYRRNFEGIIMKNGINDFTPILYESRTRNKTKQIQDAATIKSVFGLDIPPHILKKNEGKKGKKVIKKVEKEKKDEPKKEESCASTPIGSVLAAGEEDEDSELRSERSESVLGESSVSHVPKRVRRKFRKFRSGFDYIRKKKKVKADDEAAPSRKRFPVRKHVNWPEQSRDVASEVRAWVVNKGLGETVLHKAARLQYHDVVVYCAESPDFDINIRDNAGYTPLHEACNRGHLDIAQVLCAHGAHVNAPGYKGMRPLHEAVENGHGELARLLLAYGADPTLTTYAGQTCLALSADIQSTRLIEGFMADLKGQRIVDLWYFAGPVRFLDPEEQGCDIFENIPGRNSLQLREINESIQENDKKLEDPVLLEISSVDGSGKCQNTLDDPNDKDSSLHKPVKLEPNSSLKQKPLDPKVQEKENTGAECSVKESESIVESDLAKECEVKPGDINNLVKKEEVSDNKTSAAVASTSQELELDSESDAELNVHVFETCESEMLDLFEVQGRPHKYLLLLDLLQQLKLSYKEFIVSAKTVETLELSAEEFYNKASCCIVGSVRPSVVEDCSRVVLVRVTPTIEELLGIETVKL